MAQLFFDQEVGSFVIENYDLLLRNKMGDHQKIVNYLKFEFD